MTQPTPNHAGDRLGAAAGLLAPARGANGYRMLIDGRWRDAAGGQRHTVLAPADNLPIAPVADGGPSEVDAAVAAARRAFEEGPWPRLTAGQRGRMLLRVAALLEQHTEAVAWLESHDNGKPIRESRLIDVPLAVDSFEYFAGWATKAFGDTHPVRPDVLSYSLREPVGVVGGITPFNFPLLMAAWKIAPALAFGNTVVIKPSPETPLSTLLLAQLCLEAGLPDGVVNVVTGGTPAGEALVAHPGIDKLAFTGSTPVGKSIAATAADTLKRVSLELGGKAPNLIFADADLDAALAGALFGCYWCQGEICTAGSRILVQDTIYEEFTERLAAAAGGLRVGPSLDEAAQIGPLVSRRQQQRVLGYVQVGVEEGAKLLAGGGAPADPALASGNYVTPTVFAGVDNQMTIAREEIFGPVASVLRFSTEDEAVGIANDTPFGLTAGVWTRDVKRAHRLARALRAGTVWVNTYNLVVNEAPFGGIRQSGLGRETGREAIELYTEVKQVFVDLGEGGPAWFGAPR